MSSEKVYDGKDELAGSKKKNDLKHRKILECLIRKIRKRRGKLRVISGAVTDRKILFMAVLIQIHVHRDIREKSESHEAYHENSPRQPHPCDRVMMRVRCEKRRIL